jgi:ribosomal protein S18 acetylase RimI-like enzyme
MKPISIRLADFDSATDRATIESLIDAYASDPMGTGRPLSEQARSRLVEGLRSHPASLVYLAFWHDQVAGLVVCFLGFSTFAGRPLLNIHDLVVQADHRRQGIATALLQHIELDAQRRGCCKLTLEVRTDNHAAQSLYRRIGFGSGETAYEFWTKLL